ncbi:MAG TPA: hypothetical protein VI544_02520 [Candidatus Nanoarchaeia archaeon]|nr:hypothetical protein [Candidatus Nanoarchaeia archaeon]
MKWKYFSLFLSGVFFGGAIDHLILAMMNYPLTPYGVELGITGNWMLFVFDAVIALLLFWFFVKK